MSEINREWSECQRYYTPKEQLVVEWVTLSEFQMLYVSFILFVVIGGVEAMGKGVREGGWCRKLTLSHVMLDGLLIGSGCSDGVKMTHRRPKISPRRRGAKGER